MLYRIYCITFVLIFMLGACSGDSQAVTPQAQDGTITIAPASTNTFTPAPLDTPLLPPTITATASITPTTTVTPENFVLTDSGSDIADVRISYSSEDVVNVDFKYRIDMSKRVKSEIALIKMLIPEACKGPRDFDPIYYADYGGVGYGHLIYRQTTQGRCEVPFFDLVIVFKTEYGAFNETFREVYRERIRQSFKVVRNDFAISSKVLTVTDFVFHSINPLTGTLTFKYAFSPEISLTGKGYLFKLDAMGDNYACGFAAFGPVINEQEGAYVISIDLANSIHTSTCISNHQSFTYNNSMLSLEGSSYQHAIDLVFTIKNKP